MHISSSTTSSDVGARAFFTPLVPPSGRPYMSHHSNDRLYNMNRKSRQSNNPASRGAFLPFLKGSATAGLCAKRGTVYEPAANNDIPQSPAVPHAPKLPSEPLRGTRAKTHEGVRPCPMPPPFPRPSVAVPSNRIATSDFALKYTPHIQLQQTLNLRGLR